MIGASWNVHVRVPPGRGEVADLAERLARAAGDLLDAETLSSAPLRLRFAYLRRHEAERLFNALRSDVPGVVVWLEREESLGGTE